MKEKSWRDMNSTKAFNKIMAGLTDALAYAEGDKTRGKAHLIAQSPDQVRGALEKLFLGAQKIAPPV